ncbi:MAG TPA: hypothetical protein PLI13_12395, partial [Paracoccus sp. (in: a-proteobacteria)]|nr:hypothetical protein [Paracoccus sp. (in: a-proteobacteria)]
MNSPVPSAPQTAPIPPTAPPTAGSDAVTTRDWALCISTYNRGRMLRDCVRHALASTLPPAEIV